MQPVMLASEAVDYLGISLPALHKQLKTKDLEYTKRQNRVIFGHYTARKIFKLELTPSCWSWQNLKGGVGKTHLSFATAVRLSLYGARVALIDLDQQGNCTQACGIDAEEYPVLLEIIQQKLDIRDCMVPVAPGIDLLPSRIENAVLDNLFAINGLPVDKELKKRVELLKKNYDFIFIDCPPSLGQTVTSAALAADHIVLPVDPEKFSLSGLKVTLKELTERAASTFDTTFNISIVLNKFDGRTGLSHATLAALFNDEVLQKRLFKTFVRTSQDLPNSVSKGKSIYDSLKASTAKEDIDLLAREIIERSVKPNLSKHKIEISNDTIPA
jgi:chromosome partitioning protein